MVKRSMRFISIMLLIMMVWGGTGALLAQDVATTPTAEDVRLRLERAGCFGTCPIYTVTVYADGTVVYEGVRYVEVEGLQTSQIRVEQVNELVTVFAEAGFFDWDDEYMTQHVTDMPTTITTLSDGTRTRQISRYHGDAAAPLLLVYLENWLDEVIWTAQWTGAEASLSTMIEQDVPVLALQRLSCGFMCLVYDVDIYADGTVIYHGRRHVDDIGFRMYSVSSADVMDIASYAAAMGYFDWQDTYDAFFITDQATVVTTLHWQGQEKQIRRYDGDPSAPIGLLNFEQRITTLAGLQAQRAMLLD